MKWRISRGHISFCSSLLIKRAVILLCNVQPWLSVAPICPHWLQFNRLGPLAAGKSPITLQNVSTFTWASNWFYRDRQHLEQWPVKSEVILQMTRSQKLAKTSWAHQCSSSTALKMITENPSFHLNSLKLLRTLVWPHPDNLPVPLRADPFLVFWSLDLSVPFIATLSHRSFTPR